MTAYLIVSSSYKYESVGSYVNCCLNLYRNVVQMLEGRHLIDENLDSIHLKPVDFEPKFRFSKCPGRIQQ